MCCVLHKKTQAEAGRATRLGELMKDTGHDFDQAFQGAVAEMVGTRPDGVVDEDACRWRVAPCCHEL